MAIHLIVPNFEPRPRVWELPKFHRVAMVEWTDGFALAPFYSAPANCEITVCQTLIEGGKHPFAEAFRGQWCWEVVVWEYDGEQHGENPTWQEILDPECTKEDALKAAERIKQLYENTEELERLAQCFRTREPSISLPPRKPNLDHCKTPTHEYEQTWSLYQLMKESRTARFQVLKTVYPRTASLVEQYEETANETARERLEQESVEAYFAENAAGWPEHFFKAWQKLNPISLGWMKWLYVRSMKQAKKPAHVDPVDYELAFNWTFKNYHSMTAAELAEAVNKATGQRLSVDAIKKRRERLDLYSTRPPGPRPTS